MVSCAESQKGEQVLYKKKSMSRYGPPAFSAKHDKTVTLTGIHSKNG